MSGARVFNPEGASLFERPVDRGTEVHILRQAPLETSSFEFRYLTVGSFSIPPTGTERGNLILETLGENKNNDGKPRSCRPEPRLGKLRRHMLKRLMSGGTVETCDVRRHQMAVEAFDSTVRSRRGS